MLKAYSILDPDVGYCQGLSFVVGILLIHVRNNEARAFELLKFLLIDLNLREQYKPDMIALQKHMYQFSRSLNEVLNDLYVHLEVNEISSSLYAAPWFLSNYFFFFFFFFFFFNAETFSNFFDYQQRSSPLSSKSALWRACLTFCSPKALSSSLRYLTILVTAHHFFLLLLK